MKRALFKPVLILLVTGLLFAGATISNFSARSDEGNVVVSWSVSSEDNVAYYLVERSAITSQDNQIFEQIAKIPATDKSYYEFIDKTAYKSADAVYVYRIAICDKGNEKDPAHSNVISVIHNVNSVKRTWGSIKDLFR